MILDPETTGGNTHRIKFTTADGFPVPYQTCPECGTLLVTVTVGQTTIEVCPVCNGGGETLKP